MDEQLSGRAREAACPQCGSVFRCGAATGECWCQDLPQVMALADGDCLCPTCLKAAVERRGPEAELDQRAQ
jgi:hypothetical protein